MKTLKDKIIDSKDYIDNTFVIEPNEVKQNVLKFERYLEDYIDWLDGNITLNELNKKYFKKFGNPVFCIDIYKKIFGDWRK